MSWLARLMAKSKLNKFDCCVLFFLWLLCVAIQYILELLHRYVTDSMHKSINRLCNPTPFQQKKNPAHLRDDLLLPRIAKPRTKNCAYYYKSCNQNLSVRVRAVVVVAGSIYSRICHDIGYPYSLCGSVHVFLTNKW